MSWVTQKKKNAGHNIPSRELRLWPLWSISTGCNPLFRPFTWSRCAVMDQCFVQHHNSAHKFVQIPIEVRQISLVICQTNAFSLLCWQTRHTSRAKHSHATNLMYTIHVMLFERWFSLGNGSSKRKIVFYQHMNFTFFHSNKTFRRIVNTGRNKLRFEGTWNPLKQFLICCVLSSKSTQLLEQPSRVWS